MKGSISSERINEILKHEGVDEPTIEEFWKYVQSNPLVWPYFERFARERLQAGLKYGAKAIMERVRWEIDGSTLSPAGLSSKKPGQFKINNDWTAIFGRIFLIAYPQYRGSFRCKRLRGLRRARANYQQGQQQLKLRRRPGFRSRDWRAA